MVVVVGNELSVGQRKAVRQYRQIGIKEGVTFHQNRMILQDGDIPTDEVYGWETIELLTGVGMLVGSKFELIKPTKSVGPPRKLGKEGLALWGAINEHYAITDAGGVAMLLLACEQLDRAESCRKLIDTDGEMIRIKTGTREHP